MGRDHRKLRVFRLADELVPEIYRLAKSLPDSERYGLQLQLRRAVVSTATNIVEGSIRRTTRDYVQFLTVAAGSSAEVLYLIELSVRLELLRADACTGTIERCTELVKGLRALVSALEARIEVG